MNKPLGIRASKLLFDGIAYLLLTLGAVIMVLPFLWMIATY